MIREVLTLGDERLLQVSQEVTINEFNTRELDSIITDMTDTMRIKNGVGIAAIQIGIPKRIAIIGYDVTNPRYANIGNWPLTVVINPAFEAIGNELATRDEGCLSVPDQRCVIDCYKHIRYKFYDQAGKLICGETDSFFARVFQHELDHMNGLLLPMRIRRYKND